MFTMKGHFISSYKDFRDHFEYGEVIRQIKEFALWLDAGSRYMLTIQNEIGSILKLLQYADEEECPIRFGRRDCCWKSDLTGLEDEQLLRFLKEKEGLVSLLDRLVGAANLTGRQKQKAWLEGIAVYSAAACDAGELTSEMIERCYGPDRDGVVPAAFPEQINVYSGEISSYELFVPDTRSARDFLITTHIIRNCSSYGSGTAVIRLVKEGTAVYETSLLKDEYIYVNMVGPYAVKVLPNLTFCGSTVIGRPDLRKNTLWRYKVERGSARIIRSEALDLLPDKHISCMSVDYRGGLICIQEGFLRNDSPVAFEGLHSPVLKQIRFAEAYVLKTRYLLLSERGTVYSNIEQLNGLTGIYSIGFSGAKAFAWGADKTVKSAMVYEEGKQYARVMETDADIREQCFDQELAAVFTRSGICRIRKSDDVLHS